MNPVEVRLKRKYLFTQNGRFEGGERPALKKNKRLGRGSDGYNPREHVLVLVGGKRKWFHYGDAQAWLG